MNRITVEDVLEMTEEELAKFFDSLDGTGSV